MLLKHLAKQMLCSKDTLTTCSPKLTHVPAQASMRQDNPGSFYPVRVLQSRAGRKKTNKRNDRKDPRK